MLQFLLVLMMFLTVPVSADDVSEHKDQKQSVPVSADDQKQHSSC